MFLIMSGAYVAPELESEFGKIPPSFLPLGNRRLLQHQIKLAPQNTQIILSLPESYQLPMSDEKWLLENDIDIVHIPDGLSLGAAIVAALNISGYSIDKPLHVLLGDTLYEELPQGKDVVSYSTTEDGYKWTIMTEENFKWVDSNNGGLEGQKRRIVDGYFKFNKPRVLIKQITKCEWDFIQGLNLYREVVGLTPVKSIGWLDFGHVNTYYRSKAKFTTQRAFNELKITSSWIEKSSSNAEAYWFENLPFELRGNIPQFLGSRETDGKISYKLEYLHLSALNELYVFSELPLATWKHVINSCLDFVSDCKKVDSKLPSKDSNTLEKLFTFKTIDRVNDYCVSKNIKLNDLWSLNGDEPISISQILEYSEKYLPKNRDVLNVMHGDLCFSNILYDFRAKKIKVIDPRGITPEGVKTIYGDLKYDLAKLSHSILGLYDYIIAGYFSVDIKGREIKFDIINQNRSDIQQYFIEQIKIRFNISALQLYAMQIQLFLSMLPLHSDNSERQDALFANAFRLYRTIKDLEK
ncbi:capsular biosynthesis protein [Vibrio sp. VP6]|uniref:capsular biosynthesis protein n=1 Tax=Vibrio sp. VP6 TaxID=2992766 RepID=UPI00237C1B70|nr:capsular biosynthesis protein [Vibrio sp. VP6]MDE0548465.1 capsular biosynthesis protein [Vibrio sp. VP6]